MGKFQKFTFNQLNEITSNYGKIDILWLDGGWVRPFHTIDPNVEWQRTIKVEQDIDMDKIGTMAKINRNYHCRPHRSRKMGKLCDP
jgi:alpha-L-fucosidase